MSDRPDPDGHVFDQTNGVLGHEPETPEQQQVATPSRTFGVPPLTSL